MAGGRGEGCGGKRVISVTALICVLAVAGVVVTMPGTAHAQPKPPRTLEDVHKEVEGLYRQAEAATDAYNAADEAQRRQEKSITEIAKSAAEAQERMNRLKNQAGSLARAQYRDGTLPPQARLLLSGSPESFFDGVALTHKGQAATRGLITQVAVVQKTLDGYAKAAGERWKTLDGERRKKEGAKKQIEAKLAAAKELESKLEEKEKERLRQLEEERARQAQQKWLASDAVKGVALKGSGAATGEGKRAVEFASAQIGKNYVWGAEGPDTYDCSGLTLKAWAAAGRAIPRTSQDQWRQLPKVGLKDMRPGDLIIYFADASHVGVYVGDGAIVHAPRPGRQVTVAGAGSMPVLGVVRPG
ncbi:NlpC/P60 family protein [Streptomyces rectiverticillatus]|uniref:C40 family peptidase n=1 Tax=Streptomyces rectiverticillatus TaxID=173860 RepID=UPI0015C2CE75|nr:C40 family peptidase [Streptomyces rectiverticillatus]QLE73356.1 NlpC/P60 family protein [Streptomyces rectiverticillatus]